MRGDVVFKGIPLSFIDFPPRKAIRCAGVLIKITVIVPHRDLAAFERYVTRLQSVRIADARRWLGCGGRVAGVMSSSVSGFQLFDPRSSRSLD